MMRHLDHCVDYIGQSLQCSSNMTAIQIEWSDIRQRISPDFETLHTCRNFEKLKTWALIRDATKHPL